MIKPALLTAHHAKNMEADAEKATGAVPAARNIIARIGAEDNLAHVKAELLECRKAHQVPVPWLHPIISKLVDRTQSIAELPDHPQMKPMLEAFAAHGETMVVRVLHECANKRQDGTYLSDTPALYKSTFNAIAEMLPDNCIPAWAYEPSVPINVLEWKPEKAKMGNVDLYGNDAVNPIKPKCQRAGAFIQLNRAAGLPCFVGEAGDIDHKMLTAGQLAVTEFWKRYLAFCAAHEVCMIPITNDPFSGEDFVDPEMSGRWAPGPGFPPTKVPPPPPWEGNAYVVEFLKKKLASGIYIKAVPSPLKQIGVIQ